MRPALSLLIFGLAMFPPHSIAAAQPIGHAVVARSTGDALLLWDASSEVSAIVSEKLSDDAANAQLKIAALRLLAASLNTVSKDVKTVTLRVLYNKSGAVSPVYGAATFAGVEQYAEITISGTDFFRDRDRWREIREGSSLPSWLIFRVIGQLPRQ